MTGFGVGSAAFGAGRVVAEVRSVNQRFLDVRARLPRELGELTMFAEQTVRDRFRRGRLELSVRFEGTVLASSLDQARAREIYASLCALRDELAPGTEVPLSVLGCAPDLFTSAAVSDPGGLKAALSAAMSDALGAMEAMFRAEGEALAKDLADRAESLEKVLVTLAEQAERGRAEARKRARERLEVLLSGASEAARAAADAGRLEAEIALLVERGDVAEELTRLKSHVAQFVRALGAPDGEPLGRRLEFLLQEMAREVNTIGAKAQDAALSTHVVDLKVELERMREQVQNVE